jgi:cytochrome c peroxidase
LGSARRGGALLALATVLAIAGTPIFAPALAAGAKAGAKASAKAGGGEVTPTEASKHFAPLPKGADTPTNKLNPHKIALGKQLFFEPRLSKSSWISCNSCHNLATAGVDRLPTSIGHKWNIVGRNAPIVLNAALQTAQFWDGRMNTVEEQAGGPILAGGEMAATEELVLQRLGSIPEYVKAFKEAFPEDKAPLTYKNVARAIAAYERTLLTPGRFDKFLAGDANALKAEEKKGLRLFIDTGCAGCHNGATVGGNSFQKLGVVNPPDAALLKDPGRFGHTKDEKDKNVFKVPMLRNVHLSAPYFHNGSVATLEEAVKIMAKAQAGQDLADAQVAEIVAFLKALDGDPQPVTLPVLPPSTKETAPPNPN